MSNFDEALDDLSIAEQIELLEKQVNKKFEAIAIIGDLYNRLRIAAEQQLLTDSEQESLYKALVGDVNGEDWSWLIFKKENRDAIFDCLPDLSHTLPDIDDFLN